MPKEKPELSDAMRAKMSRKLPQKNPIKGTKFTRLSRRGTPAQPVEISSSKDSKTYRYNLQGEAIKESYLSDVEAVQAGYISLSILDYNLTKEDENNDLVKALCQ